MRLSESKCCSRKKTQVGSEMMEVVGKQHRQYSAKRDYGNSLKLVWILGREYCKLVVGSKLLLNKQLTFVFSIGANYLSTGFNKLCVRF